MTSAKEALEFLNAEIEKREKRQTMSFEEYLELMKQEPRGTLRSIFQLFYDMIKNYVPSATDEYPDDPESIGFVKYDCSRLFVERADNPFFADRLFANRFVRQVESLRQGFQQNRVYAYLGPSGCGKSTFLNNLLRSFEAYTDTKEGMIFEIVWEIDENLFSPDAVSGETLTVPCPSHDCPVLIIPKESRSEFLNKLLPEETAEKAQIFHEKQYDWLLKGEVCTICRAIFWSSLDKLGSLEKVLRMVKVRPYKFDRRLGEGISILNPGDKPILG
ncbi:MAG: serine protein kinase PrkA, partial [Candidatus Spechtbacteria bacterium]|nr:serine protein kinase PrkA [Candidatus Spechtbacteria bacterium]